MTGLESLTREEMLAEINHQQRLQRQQQQEEEEEEKN